MKTILIQGHSDCINQLYKVYKDDIIFSTWKGSISTYTNTVYNDIPEDPGHQNGNLQLVSTYNGAILAKSIGYTQILKVRSDIIIPEYRKLLDLLDLSVLNFFSWHNWNGGYYVDYIFGGPVDDIIRITKDISDSNVFPERRITNRVVGKVNYILPILYNNNIDCFSLKWNKNLTKTCTKDSLFTW